MLDFTRDIQPYLQLGSDDRPPAKLRHAFYQASIDHRDRLRAVFGKAYPYYLDLNRPKEREEYRQYRRQIYKNPLRSLRRRAIEALDYIRQADDFQVSFPTLKNAEATDSFEQYVMGTGFSKDGDAETWFFKNVRKKYINDPNAVLVILPVVQPESDTVRAKPVPMLIDCDRVYQHRNGEFAVLESPERVWIAGPGGREKTGKVLLFLDGDSYCVATQTAKQKTDTADGSVLLQWNITGMAEVLAENGEAGYQFTPMLHNCPVMPAKKLGKLQEDQAEAEYRTGYVTTSRYFTTGDTRYRSVESNDLGEQYFESFLADALPHIESAQAAQSDIEVERNFHVSSQEWRYSQKKCADSVEAGGNCNGGKIFLRDKDGYVIPGSTVPCKTCKGSGMDASGSGLGLIIVSAPTATSLSDEGRPTNLPTPPGGFIPRSIDPLREFVLEYEREKKQAYETINMQFLMETPLSQSGVAKRTDREELYRTLIIEGQHLCGLLETLLEWAGYQRRQETEIPKVLAPVRLSIENSELTREELSEAVKSEFDSNLRAPLERKLIEYQAGKDSDYYKRYELRELMDPYPELNFESKLFLLSAARLTMDVASEEYKTLNHRIALSVHFNGLVSDELRKENSFWNLERPVQYEKLMAGAALLTGIAKPVAVDPKTGLPNLQEGQLVPIADIKNNNQL